MSSRKEQKAQAKQARLAAQAAREAEERKARVIRWSAAGLALVIVVVGAFVLTQTSSNNPSSTNPAAGAAEAGAMIGSAKQKDMTVGDPKAKVTIVEFGDLRCPACKAFADTGYEPIFKELISTGKAKLQFNNWAILGDESITAAKASLAAGKQNKGFLFTDIFYRNQKNEAVPYVNDEFLTGIATATGLDIAKWNKDRNDPKLQIELDKIAQEAAANGFSGTPSFVIIDSKGQETPVSGSEATPEAIIELVNQSQ